MSAERAAPPLIPFERAAVAQSDRGKRVKQRDYLAEGRIPVIDQGQSPVGGYTNDDDFAFIGELPVVLFGDHTRTVKLVDQRFAVGADGIKIFRPAPGVRAKYLYYWMRSAPLPDRGYGRHYQYLRQLSLPLPSPKRQDEIVAELEKQFSRIDEAVANLKRAKANLKRFKAAVLKAAVEGRLVPTEAEIAGLDGRDYETGGQLLRSTLEARRRLWKGKRKYKEPAAPDTAVLPELPEGWVWATLEAVTDPTAPVLYGILQPGPDVAIGIPYVRPTEIEDDEIDINAIRRTSSAIASRYKRSTLALGDIVLSIVGTIGKVALIPEFMAGGNITQSSVRIRPISGGIDRNFLAWALRSPTLTRQYDRKRLGTAVPRLNVEDVRVLCIPMAPLAEQRRIVVEVNRILSVARESEADVDANLKRAQAFRHAILDKWYRGNGHER